MRSMFVNAYITQYIVFLRSVASNFNFIYILHFFIDLACFVAAVQDERGPRNSTMRRQMALLVKDSAPSEMRLPPVLDLAMPKHNLPLPPPLALFQGPYPYRINLMAPPLAPSTSKFLSPAPMIPCLLSPSEPEALCEAAARLLFMNVKWVKNVPAFNSLSLSDRLILLEESWRDLFVIGSAQFQYPIDVKILFDDKNPRINAKDVQAFESAIADFSKTRPDSNEFACLRAVVLFRTIEDKSATSCPNRTERKLQDLPTVAALQDHSLAVLSEVS